jgi:hypothetical protein
MHSVVQLQGMVCPVGEVDRLQTLAIVTVHVELVDEVQPPTDERTTAVLNRSRRVTEACIASMLNGAHMVMAQHLMRYSPPPGTGVGEMHA